MLLKKKQIGFSQNQGTVSNIQKKNKNKVKLDTIDNIVKVNGDIPSMINFDIEGKRVVLIDDVLYTGRSIRAALIAIESYGRPIKIELLTLINRRFTRHLPIQPDYVGLNVDTLQNDRVNVNLQESNMDEAVYILKDDNETNFS